MCSGTYLGLVHRGGGLWWAVGGSVPTNALGWPKLKFLVIVGTAAILNVLFLFFVLFLELSYATLKLTTSNQARS